MNSRKVPFEHDHVLHSLLVRHFDVIVDAFVYVDYFVNDIFIEGVCR